MTVWNDVDLVDQIFYTLLHICIFMNGKQGGRRVGGGGRGKATGAEGGVGREELGGEEGGKEEDKEMEEEGLREGRWHLLSSGSIGLVYKLVRFSSFPARGVMYKLCTVSTFPSPPLRHT